jgi:exopolyphosphatase
LGLQSFPPSLSILLLGVILLDSINGNEKAGKVTPRDVAAIQALQTRSDWSQLDLPPELLDDDEPHRPNNTKLFDTLQNQKFHPDFWRGLTTLQALKLDYKSFQVQGKSFGVATVLQTMKDFFERPHIVPSIREGFPNLKVFGIMFMTIQDDKPQRQLALVAPAKETLEQLVVFLQSEGSLQIKVTTTETEEDGWHLVYINQGNAAASRKQVVPILMEYFQQQQQ